MSDSVREQYELYPYPPRDPRDEAKRLIQGSPSHLQEINHYVFAGRRDFSRPFRALIAGGGTGDGAIMLAQQLADRRCPAEVHYLDLSESSRKIAEDRAAARGLKNLSFHTGSLLDLPAWAFGKFDYIDCCGVLHHLPDPAAGLTALCAALNEDGGLGLMVYGAYGRTGVYHLQEALRVLGRDDVPAVKLDLARRLLRQLPPTSWLARNPFLGDHLKAGDAGIYDLLLHSIDRPYTVGEFASLIESAGLSIAAFIEPWRYDPANFISDGALLKRLDGLGRWQRAAIAEQLTGNMKVHIAYAVPKARAESTVAQADDGKMIPVLRDSPGPELAKGLKPGGSLTARAEGLEVRMALPRTAAPLLAAIDGQTSIDGIFARVTPDLHLPRQDFNREFAALFRVFNGVNKMFLQHEPGPAA
ncbi:MAG: class I SAM-dependent methyltransferase [Dongiaceae bacterium]